MTYPERIPQAYRALDWMGMLDWRSVAADLSRLQAELMRGPVIITVEFEPGGMAPPSGDHCVIAEAFSTNSFDLHIVDPWDGARTRLLERYARKRWSLARVITGARLLQLKE